MLIDARLRQDELKIKLIQAFDDPANEGYFIDNDDPVVDFNNMSTTRNARAYASVNKAGEVIGYISYAYDVATRRFYGIGAINFTDDKLTFASDLLTLFRRAFTQKNALTIEFKAISDNPACEQYERFIKHIHGKLVGVLHDYVITPNGQLHDMNIYEIRRVDYLGGESTKPSSSTRTRNKAKPAANGNSYAHKLRMLAHQLCATIEQERGRFIVYSDEKQLMPELSISDWGYISDEYVYIKEDRLDRVFDASGIGSSKTKKSQVINTLSDAGIFCGKCRITVTQLYDNEEWESSKSVIKLNRNAEFEAFVASAG